MQKCVVLAEGAVFRHVAPGLPHEPDGRAIDGFAPARAQESALAHIRAQSSCVLYYRVCFDFTAVSRVRRRFSGGPVSPILVRPVREQFEHDRIIRVLQARYKRKYEVAINPGGEQNASVSVSDLPMFPDLSCISPDTRPQGAGHGRSRDHRIDQHARSDGRVGPVQPPACVPFICTCRPTSIDTARRLCAEHRSSPPKSGRITRRSIRCASRWSIAQRGPRRCAKPAAKPAVKESEEAGGGRARQASAAAKKAAPAKKPARAAQPPRRPRSLRRPRRPRRRPARNAKPAKASKRR